MLLQDLEGSNENCVRSFPIFLFLASIPFAVLRYCLSFKVLLDLLYTWRQGKKVLIVAHGNSLPALVKYLDDIPDDEIVQLNIPTGIPLVYELNVLMKPIKSYYLGDPEEVRKAQEAVAGQGKLK